jgi:hypothetical protein
VDHLKQILIVIAASRRLAREGRSRKAKWKIPGARIFSLLRLPSQANYG